MLVSDKYKHLIIKEYPWWTLLLSELQSPYVGRCYAWWRDRTSGEGEGMPFHTLPPESLTDLQRINKEVIAACKALGYETEPYDLNFRLNMSELRNMPAHSGHMHFHFVPRSRDAFLVNQVGIAMSDPDFDKHYRSHGKDQKLNDAQTLGIRLVMAQAIGGIV